MNEYKVFTQRILLIGVTNLLLGLSGIILLPILTKNIPIEEYGIWAQTTVTVGIVPAITMLGLPYTMVRFMPSAKNNNEVQEIFYSIFFLVLFTSLTMSVLIYLFSETIASSLFDDKSFIVKILSLIVFIECINNLLFNYFRAMQQIKKYSVIIFIQTCLYMLLISFFVVSSKGIMGALTGFFLTSCITFLIMSIIIIFEIGIKIPKFENINQYLNFGLPTIPGNLSSWVVNSSDRYVISILMGTYFVGYYSPGYSLGSIITMFLSPLSFILPAVLSKHYDENNLSEVKTILSYSLKYYLAIAIPSTLGLSLLSKPLLTVLSTPEIASNGYMITPFIALSSLFYGIFSIVQQVIILEKKTKITGKIWTISAILNLGLNFIFIPYMGIEGAAITTLIAFTLSLIVGFYYSSKSILFEIDVKFILKSIFASIIMSLIIVELDPVGLFSIITAVGICAVFYIIVLLFLKGFDEKELYFFKSMIQQVKV